MEDDSKRVEVDLFSTARTIPWGVWIPMAVDPCYMYLNEMTRLNTFPCSTELDANHTLIASIAYST